MKGYIGALLALALLICSAQGAVELTMPLDIDTDVGFYSFNETSCAMADGCIEAGDRKLLQFSTTIINVGDTGFSLGFGAADSEGWEYSVCGDVLHRSNVITARLMDDEENELLSREIDMCFYDAMPFDTLPEGIGKSNELYECDLEQGISSGWRSVYRNSLNCQWLDVTDIPEGEYTLRLELNINNINEGGELTQEEPVTASKRVLIGNTPTVYPVAENNNPEMPIDIELGTEGVRGSLLGSTLVGDEETYLEQCLTSFSGALWYRVIGTGGNLSASVCHSDTSMDSILAIFEYRPDDNDMLCIENNDDAPMCGLLSWVTWLSTEGTEYFIAVSSYYIEDTYEWKGNFKLTVIEGEMPTG